MAKLLRRVGKTLKWLLLTLLVILALLLALTYYLTATDSGYRRIPWLINTLTPFTLTYDQLEGNLMSQQRWTNLQLDGPGLKFSAETFAMDFAGGELFKRRVHLKSLRLTKAEIHLPKSTPSPEEESSGEIPSALPEISLPVDIDIDQISIAEFKVYQDGVLQVTLDDSETSAHFKGSALTLALQAQASKPEGDSAEQTLSMGTNVKAKVDFKDDYPLSLALDGQLNSATLAQSVKLSLTGSALSPVLKVTAEGDLNAEINANMQASLVEQTLDGMLAWQAINWKDGEFSSPQGEIHAKGAFSDFTVALQTALAGKGVPETRISANATITEKAVDKAKLLVETLGGTIAFNGKAQFADALNWQGELAINDIDARRFDPDLNLQMDGRLSTQGGQTEQGLQASVVLDALSGQWQEQPIHGSGQLDYHDQALNVDQLRIDLAGNSLAADGELSASRAALSLDIDAPALNHLLPGLSGKVHGNSRISGSPGNPEIATNLEWAELAYTQGGKILFASNAGKLDSKGLLSALTLVFNTAIRGDGLPDAIISGSAVVSPQAARDIDLTVKALNGQVQLNGEANYSPDVQWKLQTQVDGIELKQWLSALDTSLSTHLVSEGAIDENGVISATAELSELDGRWQGQPLSGNAQVALNGEQVRLQAAEFAIGKNSLNLSGEITGKQAKLDFALDGKQLSVLYPGLSGAISGEGHLSGDLSAPQIALQLSGNGVGFQENRIATLDIKLNSALVAGGAFDNRIVLGGIQAAGLQWKNVRLESDGSIDKHTLNLVTEGGPYNAQLGANGGLIGQSAWKGQLNQLQLSGEGLDWALRKPSALELSAQKIALQDFCLADTFSALCVSLQKAESTQLDYQIEQIDPRSFQTFIPEIVTINGIIVKGAGKTTLAPDGKINGQADLELTPGRLIIHPKNQPPVSFTLNQAQIKGRFTESVGETDVSIVFEDSGKLLANAKISNYQNPSLTGRVQVSVPDIGKFRHFVPQISELDGQIKGDLRIAGEASSPQVSGEITLDQGKVVIPEYATELEDIRIRLSARQNQTIGIDGNIGTPKGDLTVNGQLRPSPLTLNLTLDGENMLLANSKELQVQVSPSFDIRINPESGINVKGLVLIPEAKIDIPDTSSAKTVSDDVVIVQEDQPEQSEPETVPSVTPLHAEITVKLGDKVFLNNSDARLRLIGGLTVLAESGETVKGKGRIEVASGKYELYGQELDIERGWVTFSGDITNPVIDVLALREVENVKVGAELSGTPTTLELNLTSDPLMPDSFILSYLLFGRAPDAGTDDNALIQAAAVVGTKGFFPDDLASKTGLDVLDVGVGGIKAGKYLLDDLYVGMKSNFFTAVTEFLARYQITDRFSIEASSQPQDNAVDMLYEFETN